MKIKVTFAFILFSISISKVFSQYENIVEVDRVSGNHFHFGKSISNVTYVPADIHAYNENNGIFIFPTVYPDFRLFSISVFNDSIIHNPLFNTNIFSELEFSNPLNTLYGLRNDQQNNVKYFISIDPVTGNNNIIGNPISQSGLQSGYSTFNQNNNFYIVILPSKELYSINVTNGSVISNPLLILTSGEYVVHIVFDNSSNILYGLMKDNNAGKYFLISINTSNGICTKIGNGTIYGTGGGSAAIDEANQQYIYIYFDYPSYHLITLDINSGNLLHHSNPISCGGINDNFIHLEYDNLRQKLYCMHWDEYYLSASISATNNKCKGQCNGTATANMSCANPPFTYKWNTSPVQTTQTITGLCAGTYTVTVTDASNNSNTASVTITEPPAMQDSIRSNNTTCSGDSSGNALVMASGGTPGYSYNWSNGDTTKNITGLAAGTYFVTITDANGCTIKDSVTLTSVPLPVPVIAPDTNNFTLQCTPSYNSYQWYYNGIAISGATAQSYSPAQNGSYTVEVTDSNGCTGFSAAYNVVWVNIAEYAKNNTIKISPNPANSVLSIEFATVGAQNIVPVQTSHCRVYDILGTTVIEKTFTGNKINLNVRNLPKGLYLVRVESGRENFVRRFVKE